MLQVSAVAPSQPMVTPTLRALALEPWKFAGQTVTVTGNFRGRNLFGDLPDAPGKGRYDFIVRGGEGSVWVTGLAAARVGLRLRRRSPHRQQPLARDHRPVPARPRAGAHRGDEDRARPRRRRCIEPDRDDGAPVSAAPLTPAEVVFNSPTDGETDVSPTASVRVQFSKGLTEASLAGRVRASYAGRAGRQRRSVAQDDLRRAPTAPSRSSSSKPLEPLRTVKIEILEGVTAFDSAPSRRGAAHVHQSRN